MNSFNENDKMNNYKLIISYIYIHNFCNFDFKFKATKN